MLKFQKMLRILSLRLKKLYSYKKIKRVAKKESEEMLRHLIVNKTEFSSIITDSVIWNETVFKSTCESVSKIWFTFHSLREQYTSSSMKNRASQLTKWLADIEECELGLNTKFSSIASISTDSSAGISNLVRNLNLKKEEILNGVSSLLELQIKVSNKD